MNMATPLNQGKFDEYVSLCNVIQRKDKEATRQHMLNNVPVNIITRKYTNTPLHWAILNFSDTELVEMLLNRGAEIASRNQFNQTPLYLAVNSGKLNVVELLLSKNAHTGEDFPILITKAVEIANLKMVEMLIECEIHANRPINLIDAMDIATQNGYSHILQFLLMYHRAQGTDKLIPKSLISKKGVQYKKCLDLLLYHGYTINPEDKNDFSVIYNAIENEYLVIVEEFLKLGVDINKINSETDLTLLHLVCILGNAHIAELLIKYKADMNLPTGEMIRNYPKIEGPEAEKLVGKTALFIAVWNSDVRITNLLLANGANKNDDLDIFALRTSSVAIIETLLMYGTDINKVDNLGITPLHNCIAKDPQSDEINYMNPEHSFYDGWEWLWEFYNCMIYNDPIDFYNTNNIDHENIMASKVELLLSRGANVSAQTYQRKSTPLHCAIRANCPKVVDVLLKYNADITLTNSQGLSPFHYAVIFHFPNIIDVFFKHGADINVKDSRGMTFLHVACIMDDKDLIKMLLEKNANVDCLNLKQETPLHWACRTHNFKIIQILLDHQANVHAKDNRNWTLFHFLFENKAFIPTDPDLKAAHLDKLGEVCKSFIELNVDINAADSEGKTPLFNACCVGDKETVQILLKHNADINSRNTLGETLLHAAARVFHNFDILTTLLESNVDSSIVDKNGNTILHTAIMSSCETETLKALINHRFELDTSFINAKNNEGETALYMVTYRQSERMVKDLLNQGADINIINRDNSTVLHLAIKSIILVRDELEDARNNNDDFLECYQRDFDRAENIIKIFQRHVIKLETAGLYVRSEILKLINGDMKSQLNDFKYIFADVINFKKQCKEELQMLKKENVGNTTFYYLLTYDIHSLSIFEKIREILEILQSDQYEQKFPLYINIIKNRLKEAIARKKLLNILYPYGTDSYFDGLPHICVNKILNNFHNEDLKILISKMRV